MVLALSYMYLDFSDTTKVLKHTANAKFREFVLITRVKYKIKILMNKHIGNKTFSSKLMLSIPCLRMALLQI